jgi:predicted nucleotide-binding protein (sugar kinase/HSP70/actin superfamily)
MANYHVPIEFLLKSLLPGERVLPAPPVTRKTLELGSRYSPDFACAPFKYTLGSFLEALQEGADVLVQTAGGCRLGYYSEVQRQILWGLGYKFELVNLGGNEFGPLGMYRACKKLGCTVGYGRAAYYFALAFRMTAILDELEGYIRENLVFERPPGRFESLHGEFLNELKNVTGFESLRVIGGKYRRLINSVELTQPEEYLRVGLVGELYSLMEPFCNFYMEKELAKFNIALKRLINVTYLLFDKKRLASRTLKEARPFLKYEIGADGTDSVAYMKLLAERGYDGIIHLKPFGCTPEVNAMPILQNISAEYKIPVLYFSFDSQTSETGINTRLEAFRDMLEMRRKLRAK